MLLIDYIINKKTSVCYLDKRKTTFNFEENFQMIIEGSKLRVKNDTLNYLFGNLSIKDFSTTFLKYYQRLNLNFAPINFDNQTFVLTSNQQRELENTIILNMMYIHNKENGEWNPKWWHYYGAFEFISETYCLLKSLIDQDNVIYNIGAKITRQKEERFRQHIESIKYREEREQ